MTKKDPQSSGKVLARHAQGTGFDPLAPQKHTRNKNKLEIFLYNTNKKKDERGIERIWLPGMTEQMFPTNSSTENN